SFHDHQFSRLQALLHDTQTVNHGTDFHRAKLDLLLRIDDINELQRLIRSQCTVRNEKRGIFSAARETDARKKPRPQTVIVVGKDASSTHCSRVRVNTVVNEVDVALVRKAHFIGEAHLYWNWLVECADPFAFSPKLKVLQDGTLIRVGIAVKRVE